MMKGDLLRWVAEYRRRDALFLRSVMDVWWHVVARLPADVLEDAITKTLVERLDATSARALFYCDYQFVPIGSGRDGSQAKDHFIDIAVIMHNNRRRYLAYECKKLNVRREGARRSQAGSYIAEGMMRFVTGQYAEGPPVACMIGYVMDGDLTFACARIKAAIGRNRSALRLQNGPADEPPLDAMARFVTTHHRNGDDIELRHALLPFVQVA